MTTFDSSSTMDEGSLEVIGSSMDSDRMFSSSTVSVSQLAVLTLNADRLRGDIEAFCVKRKLAM